MEQETWRSRKEKRRQLMRNSFAADIAKAKVIMEEGIGAEELAQQAEKIQMVILQLQRNLIEYVEVTDEIAVHIDSAVMTDEEMDEVRQEEGKDYVCVRTAESCLDRCGLWLRDKVPPKSQRRQQVRRNMGGNTYTYTYTFYLNLI